MSYQFNKIYVNGKWIDPQVADLIDVYDPSTGGVLGAIPRGGAADVDVAVKAARKALDGEWSRITAFDRGRLLFRFASVIDKHKEELANLEAMDGGKPFAKVEREISVVVRFFEFYAGAADKFHGEIIPTNTGYRALVLREPLGVTAHIIPWNGPAMIFARTVAASLAVGNTCVVKPAEDACFAVLRIAELAQEAGLPDGVINVVTGYGHEAGAALAAHPDIDHISFTGSPEVGTLIQQAAAVNHVPVTLELGGKSPNVVFGDGDLEKAAESITQGVIANSGQVCAAGTRLLVQDAVYERMLELLHDKFVRLKVGAPTDNVDLGPLINKKQLERVRGFIAGAESDHLTVAAEGALAQSAPPGGYYHRPMLLRDVDPKNVIAQEEIFGPVLIAMPFKTEEEAVRLANGTRYGLAAGIWTRDGARQLRMVSAIRAGQVYVNSFLVGPGVELPAGGSGKSGHGREKGMEALRGLTKTKTAMICID